MTTHVNKAAYTHIDTNAVQPYTYACTYTCTYTHKLAKMFSLEILKSHVSSSSGLLYIQNLY